MRTVILSLIVAVSTAAPVYQSPTAAPSKEPFTIVLSTRKSRVEVGAHVLIDLRLTNTSTHDIPVGFWGSGGAVDTADTIDVRDSHGKLLTRTDDTGPLVGSIAVPNFFKAR
jgi:hypothetical protein